jgi:hypothetical protein
VKVGKVPFELGCYERKLNSLDNIGVDSQLPNLVEIRREVSQMIDTKEYTAERKAMNSPLCVHLSTLYKELRSIVTPIVHPYDLAFFLMSSLLVYPQHNGEHFSFTF